MSALFALFETPEQRIDRLIFEGKRRLTEDGLSCWCPVGKHWWTYPLPEVLDQGWLDDYCDAMVNDHAQCYGRVTQ